MKYISSLICSLALMALTSCASINGIGNISPDAIASVGKITEKETIINRTTERNPMMYSNYGYGYGSRRWGYDPFMMFDYGSSIREDLFYRYKVVFSQTEKMSLDSVENLNVGQCVTLWQIPNSNRAPLVDKNLDCQLPTNPALIKVTPVEKSRRFPIKNSEGLTAQIV